MKLRGRSIIFNAVKIFYDIIYSHPNLDKSDHFYGFIWEDFLMFHK